MKYLIGYWREKHIYTIYFTFCCQHGRYAIRINVLYTIRHSYNVVNMAQYI